MKTFTSLLVFCIFFTVAAKSQEFPHLKLITSPTVGGAGINILPFYEENPLYQRIFQELESSHEDIARRQAQSVAQSGIFGGLNTIGYRYNHDFGQFYVAYNRVIAPDLFHDTRYIVTDEMEIVIEASKLFSNLKEEGKISMDQKDIAAFAGISFKRKYRYVHFADSYNDALVTDVKKLFFPFIVFRKGNFFEMAPYEFVTKEDSLGVKAVGAGNIPVQPGLGLQFGGLIKYEKVAKVDIQAIGEDDNLSDEKFKISFEKEKTIEAGASVALVAEFFSFLKLTLLSYDISYELSESNRTYLSFKKDDMFTLYNYDGALFQEVLNILRFKNFNAGVIAPYAISYKKVLSESKKTKYFALIFGGVRDSKTSHIELVKDGVVESFFRHNYEKIRYRENLFSRLLNALISSILRINTVATKDYNEVRKLEFEYKSTNDIVEQKSDFNLTNDDGDMSLHYNYEFNAAKTTGAINKKVKSYAVSGLGAFTGINNSIRSAVEDERLVGPMNISGHYRVAKSGVEVFLQRDKDEVLNIIKDQCGMKSKNILKRIRSLFSSCKNNLYTSYDRFLREWGQKNYSYSEFKQCTKKVKFLGFRFRRHMSKGCLSTKTKKEAILSEVPLWRLKDVVREIFYQANNKDDLTRYFRSSDLFSHGSFYANSSTGAEFKTYFTNGTFNGVGVVKNFMLENNYRTPASIDLE